MEPSLVLARNTNKGDGQEGSNFLNNEIMGENGPGLIEYMFNATNGEPLDFKARGADPNASPQEAEQHLYRGMAITNVAGVSEPGKITIASARDVGNIAAGFVAGNNGMGWSEARLGFDARESYQQGRIATEGATTQNAKRVGFDAGRARYSKDHPWKSLLNPAKPYPPR